VAALVEFRRLDEWDFDDPVPPVASVGSGPNEKQRVNDIPDRHALLHQKYARTRTVARQEIREGSWHRVEIMRYQESIMCRGKIQHLAYL